jgi:hypothetical protein
MTWLKSELFPWYYSHEPFGTMTTVNFLASWMNTHKMRSHTMESVSYRYSSNLNIITELKYEVLPAVTINSMVFWEGIPCRLENRYVLTFDRILMHPSVRHSQNTRCHISGNSNVQRTWTESQKCCKDSQLQPEFPNNEARKKYSWHLTICMTVLSVTSEWRNSMVLQDKLICYHHSNLRQYNTAHIAMVYFLMKHIYTFDLNLNFSITIFLCDFSTKTL